MTTGASSNRLFVASIIGFQGCKSPPRTYFGDELQLRTPHDGTVDRTASTAAAMPYHCMCAFFGFHMVPCPARHECIFACSCTADHIDPMCRARRRCAFAYVLPAAMAMAAMAMAAVNL